MYNLTVDEAHTFFVGEGEWLVHNTDGCLIGFAKGYGADAVDGMRKGGGHAIKHLIDAGIVPNKGTLAFKVGEFEKIAVPILENPTVTSSWRVGGTQGQAFAGQVNGEWVVLVVAKDGPYQGKVVSSFIPDANQKALMGIK